MKKHIIIGSIICLATLLIFIAFWGQLPTKTCCCVWYSCDLCIIKSGIWFYIDKKTGKENIYVLYYSCCCYYYSRCSISVSIINVCLRNIRLMTLGNGIIFF